MKVPTIAEFQRQFSIAQDSDKKAYRARYAAGRALLALRQRVESTGSEWWEFYSSESVRCRGDAVLCLAIAAWEVDEPKAMAHPDLRVEIARLQRRSGQERSSTPEEREAKLIRKRTQIRERVRRWRKRRT
jgi:hypothetical protein